MADSQQSSDMVERVREAIQLELHTQGDIRLIGDADALAHVVLEASHHAELVEALRKVRELSATYVGTEGEAMAQVYDYIAASALAKIGDTQ